MLKVHNIPILCHLCQGKKKKKKIAPSVNPWHSLCTSGDHKSQWLKDIQNSSEDNKPLHTRIHESMMFTVTHNVSFIHHNTQKREHVIEYWEVCFIMGSPQRYTCTHGWGFVFSVMHNASCALCIKFCRALSSINKSKNLEPSSLGLYCTLSWKLKTDLVTCSQ